MRSPSPAGLRHGLLAPRACRTLRDELKAQQDLFIAGLAGLGFEVHPPQGTYFVTADINGLTDLDGTEFCRLLPDRAGVVAIFLRRQGHRPHPGQVRVL